MRKSSIKNQICRYFDDVIVITSPIKRHKIFPFCPPPPQSKFMATSVSLALICRIVTHLLLSSKMAKFVRQQTKCFNYNKNFIIMDFLYWYYLTFVLLDRLRFLGAILHLQGRNSALQWHTNSNRHKI